MADRIEIKDVSVPAGTTVAGALTFPMQWQEGVLTRLEVRFPPGPAGLVGFQIWHSGQRIIPYRDDAWALGDNESLDWDLSGYPIGAAWAVKAYNLDLYLHTLQFRWHLDEWRAQPVGPVPLVPIMQQAPAEDASPPNVDEPELIDAPEPEPVPELEAAP